jgi:hypothetical protein
MQQVCTGYTSTLGRCQQTVRPDLRVDNVDIRGKARRVGPGRNHSPRHPTHIVPLSFERFLVEWYLCSGEHCRNGHPMKREPISTMLE